MDPHSLLASAAINIGMALVVISLFSLLKRRPSNSPIYYPRRHPLPRPSPRRRFLPSFSWIPGVLRVSEDDILLTSGLDALVVIRLFKFGIKFFSVCCFLGVFVLLPVNYIGQKDFLQTHQNMDTFSISNVERGSDRLWVHFACLWFISFYALYLLYKEYKEILSKRIDQLRLFRDRPDQFTILVKGIPACTEHRSYSCSVDHFFSKHYPNTYHACQMVYNGRALEQLLNQAKSAADKIEDFKTSSTLHSERQSREPLLSNASGEYSAKISQQEDKLEELSRRIRQIQGSLKGKELPVAFVTFKSRWSAALAAQAQHHPHPLLWSTQAAPEPRDVSWRNLAVSRRIFPLYKVGIVVAATFLTIFFAVPVTAVQGIAKLEKLKKWFPLAMAVELIPGLSSIVTGYLPSVILNSFIYGVPFAMLGMAKLAGYVSNSKEELRACNMVFYFLVGNVFFLSLLSGSLLEGIGESVAHPKSIPGHLARAVSAQGDFFITYILTDGLSGFSLEILQPGLLLWDAARTLACCCRKREKPYLFSFPYFRVIPVVSLAILIGMVYAVVTPLLLPFLIVYFCLGYIVFLNQIQDVYDFKYETCGKFWPYIHHYILTSVILMQITMIGLFGLKSKPAAAISTVPLLFLSFLFQGYCKLRFYPTFHHFPIQDATENDELDRVSGQLEPRCERALRAYCPPFLQQTNHGASSESVTV
ncbi:hypothetical protein MLD38_008851 [Melastoma candidum]|uniref:Uncharacterized protein n=1 Tax=Melastoma candidum TaxID=119954 RepID=A0ACB9RVB5_9MYRT|nr:hypothetical protein MLD38_008851 [Melastoma candidum]